MTRINYLIGWSERTIGVTLPDRISPALRIPLVALGSAAALVALLWAVQASRLNAIEREGAAYAQRQAAIASDVAAVRTVERDVVRLRALSERTARIRGSGDAAASEIAALGNRLPAGVWLTSLRADHGALALEGHGARVASVGAAMEALASLPAYSGTRLLTVRGEPARSGVTYALALERRR